MDDLDSPDSSISEFENDQPLDDSTIDVPPPWPDLKTCHGNNYEMPPVQTTWNYWQGVATLQKRPSTIEKGVNGAPNTPQPVLTGSLPKVSLPQPYPLVCRHCDAEFPYFEAFRAHLVSHSLSNRFQCNLCHLTFDRPLFLNEHLQSHLGSEGYPCDVCSKTFANRKLLAGHLRRHQEGEATKHPCPYCRRSFPCGVYLEHHFRAHLNLRWSRCANCCAGFALKRIFGVFKDDFIETEDLKDELESVKDAEGSTGDLGQTAMNSSGTSFPCPDCGTLFFRSILLTIHRRRCHPTSSNDFKEFHPG